LSRLAREFFLGETDLVARALLGAYLVRQYRGQRLVGKVVECEAYVGEDDTACHASRGMTARNAVMFGAPGNAYVYFTYGMHWMLNVVTEREGFPAAVLIRALEPVEGIEVMRRLREERGVVRCQTDLTSGPAKLTQALAIDRSLNGVDMVDGNALWWERDESIPEHLIASGPRIGINYAAEKDRSVSWRFWIDGNGYVSRPR
jgi:DNA-3-methyladenine glycosylase